MIVIGANSALFSSAMFSASLAVTVEEGIVAVAVLSLFLFLFFQVPSLYKLNNYIKTQV